VSNTQPIKDYLAAVDALSKGRQDEAIDLLARAVGAGEPTSVMHGSIHSLLTPGTRANDGILKLVANEVSKRREESG
jgi:hypothetical protein